MDSKDRLTAKYREREAKERLLARFRSEEPQWHHGDAGAVFANVKTAAFPLDKEAGGDDFGNEAPVPFPKNDPGGATGKKRNIPKDHPFDPKSLKPLAKALWASSVAMGHALTAYRHLSRLKSATISPDGMLGGRGYVMEIPEIRQRLNEACESLSAITDTIHDEISAPHWKPRISELDENEAGDIQNYLNKSEEILENPEEEAENEANAIEKQNDLNEMDGVDDEGNLPQEEGGQGAEGQTPPAEGEEGEEPAEGNEEEQDGGSFQEDAEEGDEEAPPAEGDEEAEEPTEEGDDEEPEEDEDGAAEDETLDEQEGDEGWEEGDDEDAEGGDLPPEGEDGESEEGDEEAEEPGDEEVEDAEEGDEDEDAEEGDEEDEDEEEGDPDLAIDEDDLETAERAADATEDLWTKAKPSAVKPGGDSPEEPAEGEEKEPAEGEEKEPADEEADAAPADEEEEPPMPPNPKIKKKKKKKPGKPPMASELPTGGSNAGADLADKPQGPNQGISGKQARVANSSIPVQTLPGPRVQHLDREDGPPENGPDVLDDWGTPSERDYLYPTPWENDTHHGSAAMPDAGMDDTPTEAWDFGLGYGAKGQGAGGYANPSGEGNGKGVWGPSSGLPGSPPQSSGDTTPKIDKEQNERKASIATFDQIQQYARDTLPGDNDSPAARSDYYRGDRGNLVNTQSELPGEPTPGGEAAPSLMNTDEVHEDLSTPYVRYDYTTHGYRDDPLHSWPQGHHAAGMKNDG